MEYSILGTLLKPEVLALIERRDWGQLRDALSEWPPAEVSDLLLQLPKRDRVLFFRALPRDLGAAAFSDLRSENKNALLEDLTDDETRDLLASLSPDDRTQILAELPGRVTQRMLNLLNPEDLKQARELLGYPEESVGRLMTPDYVAIRPHWTIEQALAHIRVHGRDSETIDRVYIVDEEWRLLDDIGLRRLILAEPGTMVEETMDPSFAYISAFSDREEAVHMIQRYDLVALPVLDSDGVLLGIVTVDDLLDVAEAEATEDFHKVGSVDPIQTSILEATIGRLYRHRIGWLLALVGMNIFSGTGIAFFEDTIAATVALVFFLPLLIDSAGNAGSQSATLVVRGIATGDVQSRDWMRMAGKEFGVSLALALTMAAAVFIVGYFRGGAALGLVVALTMTIVVVVGSLVGLLLPFIFTRFDLDPATASAPLVTSIADITGVIIYFSIATWILGS